MSDTMELLDKKKVGSVAKPIPPKLTKEEELAAKKNARSTVIGKDGLAGNAIEAMKKRKQILDDI